MKAALTEILAGLLGGGDLTEAQATHVMKALASGDTEPAMAGALLAALRCRGESPDEIRGFALAMRELAIRPQLPDDAKAVDISGTGGDGAGSLNLSTGAGLLAAAAGMTVVKHGNRAVSSGSGSSDVLTALGIPLPETAEAAADCLAKCGFSFLFAPYFHPAMKAVAPIRQAMGVRTVFNVLGPLTNPAQPPYQVIGAFSPEIAELMAETMSGLPVARAFVVHGEPGWDEVTPVGRFLLFDVRPGQVNRETRDPADYGVPRCEPDDLAGRDPQYNARSLEAVLTGEDTGPHRDALVLAAGLVLELTGSAPGLSEGMGVVGDAIDHGSARELLHRLRSWKAPT